MKHVGMLKTTGTKVIIAYRTIPDDAHSSLVIDRDAMLPFEEDIIEGLLESKDGQDAFEFAVEFSFTCNCCCLCSCVSY